MNTKNFILTRTLSLDMYQKNKRVFVFIPSGNVPGFPEQQKEWMKLYAESWGIKSEKWKLNQVYTTFFILIDYSIEEAMNDFKKACESCDIININHFVSSFDGTNIIRKGSFDVRKKYSDI